MNIIKVKSRRNIPKNFTGMVDLFNEGKQWLKNGRLHRLNGPAVELVNGTKIWYMEGKRHRINGPAYEDAQDDKGWWIEDIWYTSFRLRYLIDTSVYIEKQNGNHNLDWIKFLTEEGIEQFPVIPGMEQDNNFKPLFNQLFGAP